MALDNTNLYYDSSEADNLNKLKLADEAVARAGYLFRDAVTKEEMLGTMTDNGAVVQKINPGEKYTIPYGFHDGNGYVYVGELSEYTQANATSDKIANNATAWVNGEKVIGTLDVRENEQIGTATADDLLYGKTAWVNRKQITGTITTLAREDKLLKAGESYTFPKGYTEGTSVITAMSLASQTQATATASDIKLGATAWVDGELVTGEYKASEEIKELLADTDAEMVNVLAGKKFYSSKYNEIRSGTMVNNTGLLSRTINCGESYTIPQGYHDGSTVISAQTLRDATYDATAHAEHIFTGETGYVAGEKITGTMTDNGAVTATLACDATYTIPKGYHNGNGYIKGESLANLTQGTAQQPYILTGYTAWVNGKQLTGTMVTNDVTEVVLTSGQTYTIPQGYHTGAGVVRAEVISKQTPGTASPTSMLEGVTAWVNGVQITGTIPIINEEDRKLAPGESIVIEYGLHKGGTIVSTDTLDKLTPGTAVAEHMYYQEVAWVNGQKVIGTMPDNTGYRKQLSAGEVISVPGGYYEENGSTIIAPTVSSVTPATALKSDIKLNKTAWVNGELLEGTMPVYSNGEEILVAGTSITIPEGYHTGIEVVTAQDLASQTQASAAAQYIRQGLTAWVNGILITGTMNANSASTEYLNCGESYIIPEGYHSGAGSVVANSLASQTEADAIANEIVLDKTAWVNGVKVTGTLALTDADVDPSNVIYGKKYYKDDLYNTVTGTMPVNDSIHVTLDCNQEYIIPLGYHDGTSKVSVTPLADQTQGTAHKEHILSGETAWVNGIQVTGEMPNKANNSFIDIIAGATIPIPEGYYNGTGYITTTPLSLQTEADATASEIIYGKTAWVNGVKLTGEIPDKSNTSFTNLLAGVNISIPKGYYNGSGNITTATLASQTVSDATASTILDGKTAWVNGVKLTGTYKLSEETPGTADANTILSGKTAWVNGVQITGTVANADVIKF